jgi:hypothetical protein
MNAQFEQPHTLPRVAHLDEFSFGLLIRGGTLPLANLLFFLSSPGRQNLDHREEEFAQAPRLHSTSIHPSLATASCDANQTC